MLQLTLRTALLLLIAFLAAHAFKTNKFVKPGMHPDLFPEQEFDDDAQLCTPREPCGFYSFYGASRNGSPMTWVKSWCKCGVDFDCVYSTTDIRSRMFRHVCIRKLSPELMDEGYTA
ncbi:unnamed protein product, partial [Mesorhabditis spiculigera]